MEEVGAELALVFWRVLRRVREWAETLPEEREGLFGLNKRDARERLGAACRDVPELVEPFGIFALMVRAPHLVEPWLLSDACHQVHEWAEERSFVLTAMLFAEAAATADPESPARANDAGRMCRRAARDDRASSWYHRAFGLGVRHKARQETIRAQLGYGNLMKDLGEYEEARRYFEKAAQRAINTGRRRQAGAAHHDLLAIASETGRYEASIRHVRKALELYPIQHPRIPYLIHDFAFVLLRHHFYTYTLSILNHLLTAIHRPDELVLLHGTVARAAGGARYRNRYDEAERRVLDLIKVHEEYTPAALIHLAEGARAFEVWDQAKEYAARALEIARKRQEFQLVKDAKELLNQVALRESAPYEERPPNPEQLEHLILRFEARLRRRKAPGRSGPEADEIIAGGAQTA